MNYLWNCNFISEIRIDRIIRRCSTWCSFSSLYYLQSEYMIYTHIYSIEAVSYSSKSTVIVTCNVRPPASIWIVLASSIILREALEGDGWIKKAKGEKIIDERFGIYYIYNNFRSCAFMYSNSYQSLVLPSVYPI